MSWFKSQCCTLSFALPGGHWRGAGTGRRSRRGCWGGVYPEDLRVRDRHRYVPYHRDRHWYVPSHRDYYRYVTDSSPPTETVTDTSTNTKKSECSRSSQPPILGRSASAKQSLVRLQIPGRSASARPSQVRLPILGISASTRQSQGHPQIPWISARTRPSQVRPQIPYIHQYGKICEYDMITGASPNTVQDLRVWDRRR